MKTPVFVVAILCAAVVAIGRPAVAGVAGGWEKARVDDPQVVAAARFALKETQKKHKKLALDRIAAAEQQVVAGMNYRVLLLLTDRSSGKPVKREADAVVYKNLDGDYSLTSWK